MTDEKKMTYTLASTWLVKRTLHNHSWAWLRQKYYFNKEESFKNFLNSKIEFDDWIPITLEEWHKIFDHTQKFEVSRKYKENSNIFDKEYKWHFSHMNP